MNQLQRLALRHIRTLCGETFTLVSQLSKWVPSDTDPRLRIRIQEEIQENLREQDKWLLALLNQDEKKEIHDA